MSAETLEKLFERIAEWVSHSKQAKNIKIIWHGGEPTLMPLSFFYKAIRLQEQLEQTLGSQLHIKNNIQTNLLYLDEEKLEMLDILLSGNGRKSTIGTSYEPLAGIRKIKNGNYNDLWEKSFALLKARDFPFGIVYVVHKRSIENIESVVETFLEKFPGTGIRFNPLYKEGKAAGSLCEPLVITPLEWGDFLVKLYRTWETLDKKPRWQPLVEIDNYHSGRGAGICCDHAGRCAHTHLGIDTDGTVYSCGRGIDRGHRPYGNIHEKRISDILKNPARMEMINRAAFLRTTYCSRCKWWRYCHGGCPMDAAIDNNNDIFKKSNFCISRNRFLSTIYKEPVQ